MTERKQEVIEIFRRYGVQNNEALYDRLALLMVREFPDEALKDLLDLIPDKEALFWKIKCLIERAISFGIGSNDLDKDWRIEKIGYVDGLMIELNTLWEGPDHIADLSKKGTDDELKKIYEAQDRLGVVYPQHSRKPKGTCQTCGGSGEIDHMTPSGDEELGIDCPDCTGECQHKDIKTYGGCLYCRDCNEYIKERRKDKAVTAWLYGPPSAPVMIYADDGGWYIDRRTLPARRKAQVAQSERSGA
ncbi:hypothetical protein LCGC14_0821330 [marine sediment metagenome]|uniref:Uncharacterized protein n=1 Tax=marine sediment metagenome TaxID=412755 RepID=A0A0F9PIP9_9ZZZZ